MTEYTWRAAAGHWRLVRPLTLEERQSGLRRGTLIGYAGSVVPVGAGGGWSVVPRHSMNSIRLPADLTLDEALDAAKLILLAGERT